jgi:hypothetical protein
MSELSEAAKLIKSGFIVIDSETNAIVQILAVQHNPKSLSRNLLSPSNLAPGSEPREVITLRLLLDATEQGQASGAASNQNGIYPLLSALELLSYVPAGPPTAIPWIVFVWGGKRILPVRLTEVQIVEQSFDAVLNPVRAEADLAQGSFGRSLWEEHVRQMRALAAAAPPATLADLGLTAVA